MAFPPSSGDARLRTERIAILALFVGAVTIAFAPILVRLSELGPSATGFHRFLLAIPLYWAIATTLPRAAAGAAPRQGPTYSDTFTQSVEQDADY